MQRILLFITLLCSAPLWAQYANVTDTHITDLNGNVLAVGTECLQPVNQQRVPIAGSYPGGTFTKVQVCHQVTNGVVVPFTVVKSTVTNPQNVCYMRTIIDASTNAFVIGPQDGFACVQIGGDVDLYSVPPYFTNLPLVLGGLAGGAGSGSVSSVALTMPDIFNVSGSPITGGGTLAVTWGSFAAHRVLAAPAGGGTPVVRQLTMDDIAAAFGFASFSCTGTGVYEIGTVVPSVTCNVSSTSTMTSATFSDGTAYNIASCAGNTSCSATLSAGYSLSAAGNITFTFQIVGASSPSQSAQITELPRVFAGIGAAGANATVLVGSAGDCGGTAGTCVILSTGDKLYSYGLTTSTSGYHFGPFSPSGQKVYVFTVDSSASFKDGNGFGFSFDAPQSVDYVNVNHDHVAMKLYDSSSVLSTPDPSKPYYAVQQ